MGRKERGGEVMKQSRKKVKQAKPCLLDLFCGAGGAAKGYLDAGWSVVGVDVRKQPRYPGVFVQADALAYVGKFATPDLMPQVRMALEATGKPWIIENVRGAPFCRPCVMLCGLMFGLPLFRHRLFESNCLLLTPVHPSHAGKRIGENGFCCVAGHGGQWTGYASNFTRKRLPKEVTRVAAWRQAMGIDWMTRDELSQALPPDYTHYLGGQLLAFVE